ncbi:MAG: RraA family protein [Hyphomicrobiales bacterium]|nr:RraA family protein [Hyphomicrobiales bacterium]
MAMDKNLARLRSLDICDLSDAIDALGLEPAVTGLIQASAGKPVAGRAVTVKLIAGNAPGGSARHLCTHVVEAAGPDNVIVIEQRSGVDAAAWGGILSRAAQVRGVAGTVIDGPARDIEESDRTGYTVYARTLTCRTARGRIHETESQTPIDFGNTRVHPGDYIAIDRSGCVVIPADRIGDVLARAEQIRDKSDDMAAAVYNGVPVSKVMGGDYERMLET